jgi:membrane carboxypeptidase/penicillin-binding protein PbpC
MGQILEFYLNMLYFGDGASGTGAASARYFWHLPAQVDLAQAVLLVGLVQAPSADDPLCHPAAARVRQQEVLGRLWTEGIITAAQEVGQRRKIPFLGARGPPASGSLLRELRKPPGSGQYVSPAMSSLAEASGSINQKVAPSPGRLSTPTCP